MKLKLVAVQLETNHANTDGTAWYLCTKGALDTGELPDYDAFKEEVRELAKKDGAPLSIDFGDGTEEPEEVPNALSKHAKLRRYCVGAAV